MPRFNERGEIISQTTDQSSPHLYSQNQAITPQNGRSNYLTATSIISPIIYSIVGVILNEVLTVGWEPLAALVVGALFGLIVTTIYNFSYAKYADGSTKDYLGSLGMPAVVLIVIGGIVVVIIVAIILFVLAGLASGGG